MKGATFKKFAIKALIFAKKASPYVLAGLSAVGTIVTTVEAIKEIKKNTPEVYYAKQDDLIDDLDKKEENGVVVRICDNKFDIIKNKTIDFAKTYWMPIVFGTGSIACQVGSVFIFAKREKKLKVATYQMESLLNNYVRAMKATAGAEGIALVNKIAPEPPIEEEELYDDGLTLFWDPVFNYWFRADEKDFIKAAYDTSCSFTLYGGESVENFYTRMGVDPPKDEHGDEYYGWGWYLTDDYVSSWCEYSGYISISYSPIQHTDDGLEYRMVVYFQEPIVDVDWIIYDIRKSLDYT